MIRKIVYSILILAVLLVVRYYIDNNVFLQEDSYDGSYHPPRSSTVIDGWIKNPSIVKDYFYLGRADKVEFWQWEQDGDICHAVKHVDDSFDQVEVGCPSLSRVKSDGIVIDYEKGGERITAWFPGQYPEGSKASNPLILKSSPINPDPIECTDVNPEVCASMYKYDIGDQVVDFFKDYSLLFYANYKFIMPDGTEFVYRTERGEVLGLEV